METLWLVLILLIATRGFGGLASKLGQPILVGELLAGVFLGILFRQFGSLEFLPSNVADDHHLMALADLGIFFLMLLGGFEMRPKDLIESSYKGLIIAVSAMLVPLLGGISLSWYWLPDTELRLSQAMLVGTALAITAVPVTIKVFMDLDMLHTAIGKLVVSAAVFDDFLSLILLSLLIALINTGAFPSMMEILLILFNVALFVTLMFLLGKYAMPPLARWVSTSQLEEIEFSFLLLVGAAFAILAEILGLHFILGAFAAGLFYGEHTVSSSVYREIYKKLLAITSGFLAPIFFASIGFQLNLSSMTEVPIFLLSLVSIAFLGKLIGAAVPARLLGLTKRDSWAIGTAMNARGAVGLIIAGIALESGVFEIPQGESLVVQNLFSSIVIVVILTTVLAPMGVKFLYSERRDTN